MRKVLISYKVVSHHLEEQLAEEVLASAKKGYELVGGVSSYFHPNYFGNGHEILTQAMAMYDRLLDE